MSHGLGLITQMRQYQSLHSSNVAFVAPVMQSKSKFGLPSAFDALLYQGNYSALDLITNITSFKPRSRFFGFGNFISDFAYSGSPFQAALDLHSMFTSNNMVSRISDDEYLDVFSPAEFNPYKSGTHATLDAFQSPEYTIAPYPFKGVSLNRTMQSNNLKYVYGPKTIKIFETLGYSTKMNPKNMEQFTLV